jgi:hypothetical protein
MKKKTLSMCPEAQRLTDAGAFSTQVL